MLYLFMITIFQNFEKLKDKKFIEEQILEIPCPKHVLFESRKTKEFKTKIVDKINEFLASDGKKIEIDCGSQYLLKKLLKYHIFLSNK